MQELRDVLRRNRRRFIKDYRQAGSWTRSFGGPPPRGPSILSGVHRHGCDAWVRESEKALAEACDVIGEVRRYSETLYAKRLVNLPAFERLVKAHIHSGGPEEWRSVLDYTLQHFHDAVKHAVTDGKAPRSNKGCWYMHTGPSFGGLKCRNTSTKP